MELIIAAAVVLGFIILGVVLQAGLLMLAANMAADKPVGFGQAIGITVAATLINLVVQALIAFSSGGGPLFTFPITLLVWGGTISVVADMRLSQAVFTAIGMTIIQTILAVIAIASLASLAITAGAFQ